MKHGNRLQLNDSYYLSKIGHGFIQKTTHYTDVDEKEETGLLKPYSTDLETSAQPLRISEKILGMKPRIDLKSFDSFFSILKNERTVFRIILNSQQ